MTKKNQTILVVSLLAVAAFLFLRRRSVTKGGATTNDASTTSTPSTAEVTSSDLPQEPIVSVQSTDDRGTFNEVVLQNTAAISSPQVAMDLQSQHTTRVQEAARYN